MEEVKQRLKTEECGLCGGSRQPTSESAKALGDDEKRSNNHMDRIFFNEVRQPFYCF